MTPLLRRVCLASVLSLAATGAHSQVVAYDEDLQREYVASQLGGDKALAAEMTEFLNKMFDWYQADDEPSYDSVAVFNKAVTDTIRLRNEARADYDLLICTIRHAKPDPTGRMGWAPARENRFFEWLVNMAHRTRGPSYRGPRDCGPIA